ncbi:hypothetical protein EC973_000065 [Apophysomyces ossiformis]|uniref:Uncharacterized protein n=1 Tax=Apophysomyces ossiformis TaxID=679940 RepID=A0A8H7EUQ0_9FUNG|nr:hypothetical protein EC973_000065 [Apophysomyces ossiformis]
MHAWCSERAHVLNGDKILGLVNVFPLLASIFAITFLGGHEPWTYGFLEIRDSAYGFVNYCGLLDQRRDMFYPLLYHRCLLTNATWFSAIVCCVLWMGLTIFAYVMQPKARRQICSDKPRKPVVRKARTEASLRTERSDDTIRLPIHTDRDGVIDQVAAKQCESPDKVSKAAEWQPDGEQTTPPAVHVHPSAVTWPVKGSQRRFFHDPSSQPTIYCINGFS